MRILIHADRGDKTAASLENQVQDQLQEVRISRSRELAGLARELGQPLNNILAIIIFVHTSEALNSLFTLRSFFENKKLILVLPGQDNQTFIRGLQLNPSFISRAAEDARDVFMVLDRIIGRQKAMTQISMHLKTYK